MSDERIDIEVSDKVDKSVETKLTGIAAAAREGYSAVEKLKGALADINTSPVDRLAEASAKVSNALARELSAQARLTNAIQNQGAASAKAELGKARLASESAKAALAEQKLSTELEKTRQALARAEAAETQAALASTRLQTAEARLVATEERKKAALAASTAAQDLANKVAMQGASASGLQRHEATNLAAQLQDIVISLKGGQNPITVFLQQGSQIGQIFQSSGKSVMQFAGAIAAGVLEMLPMIAIVTALGFAAAFLYKKLSETATKNKELAKTIAELHVEIEGQRSATELAKDGLSAYNAWLDNNTTAVLNNAKALRVAALEQLNLNSLKASAAAKELKENNTRKTSRAIVYTGGGGQKGLDAYNKAQQDADKLAALAQDNLRKAGQAPDIAFSSKMQSDKLKADKAAASADKVAENAALSRAKAIAKLRDEVKLEIENELQRVGLGKDEREVQGRLDQITQRFAEHKATLSAEELKDYRDKIAAIQEMQRVQSVADTIQQAADGPAQAYNDTLKAAGMLYGQGKITLAAYTEEVNKATLAYANFTQPLLAANKELDDQSALLGLYGTDLATATYLQQEQNKAIAQGRTLYDASTGALTSEAAALRDKYAALQSGLYVQQEVNAIYNDVTAQDKFLANITAMYAEVDRLRAADKLSEAQAFQAKAKLEQKFSEQRLSNYSSMFGNLAKLSSVGNKKLAAIGKAAAIAQATIDGFAAVQKALASAPPPLNFALAAATGVATAVQIAGIANTSVGNFNEGGSFVVGGNQGVDKNQISMGVSNGERVTIETKKQQDAKGSGDIYVYNQAPGVTVQTERLSSGDVRVIVREEIDKQVPGVNQKELGNPNSKTSKALAGAFSVERKR